MCDTFWCKAVRNLKLYEISQELTDIYAWFISKRIDIFSPLGK